MSDKIPAKLVIHGIKGDKGEKGDILADGFVTIRGSDGADGQPGPKGDAGPMGPPGADGKDGLRGPKGDSGKDGADGKDGVDGKDGKDGADGKDGSPDTGVEIVQKLVGLAKEDQLPYSAIKGAPEFRSGSSTADVAFTNLTDAPKSYTGQGGKVVGVRADASGLEFVAGGGGGGVTGSTGQVVWLSGVNTAVGNTKIMTDADGKLTIGSSSAPSASLEVWAKTGTAASMIVADPALTQPFGFAPPGAVFTFSENTPSEGGAICAAFTTGASGPALQFAGLNGGTTPTDPAVKFIAARNDGSNNPTPYADNVAAIVFASFAGDYLRVYGNGRAVFLGRVNTSKGTDVVAANDLILGADGNVFKITGNTQINAVTTTNWTAGAQITLIFTGTPTVKHNTTGGAGTAPILLDGSVDLIAANNTVLGLVYDGAQWQQTFLKAA